MRILTLFLDIFFAPHCISCKWEGKYLCNECIQNLPPSLFSYEQDIYFFNYLDEAWMHQAVHLLKYQGITSVFDYYLKERKDKVQDWLLTKNICFIPVPSSRKRLKQRGYNQAEVLARKMTFFWGGFTAAQLLKKYERKSLVGRTRIERQLQATQQFYWGSGTIPEADLYLVIDDVLTTGSTLKACIELVRAHTNKRVMGLTIAHER